MCEVPETCGDPDHTIHQHADGAWWFPEHRDSYATPLPPIVERGPFATEREAKVAANAYLAVLLPIDELKAAGPRISFAPGSIAHTDGIE